MAKVNVVYDTSTKEISVKVDGEELSNVRSVSFYETMCCGEESEGKLNCSIMTSEEDEEGGLEKSTHYYSHSSLEAKSINPEESIKDIPGFVGVEEVNSYKALSDFITKGLRLE